MEIFHKIDVIDSVALLIGILVPLLLYLDRIIARKQRTTLELWSHWNSEHMLKRRSRVWEALAYQGDAGDAPKIMWSGLCQSDLWEDFAAINHFVSDCFSLYKGNLLDSNLATDLFGDVLTETLEHFNRRIDYNNKSGLDMYNKQLKPMLDYIKLTRDYLK